MTPNEMLKGQETKLSETNSQKSNGSNIATSAFNNGFQVTGYSQQSYQTLLELGAFLMGLTSSIRETYTYASNNIFYCLLPNYYRDYAYKYIRLACQWVDGYVPSLHGQPQLNIMSTRIASCLISGLSRYIVGEKILFKVTDTGKENAIETLNKVRQWYKDNDIKGSIYSAVGYALTTGSSLMKINKTLYNEFWWESVRADNCFYRTSFRNKVEEAKFLIKRYVDTLNKNRQFMLVEHRFYAISNGKIGMTADEQTINFYVEHRKGEKVPMVVYEVYEVSGTALQNLMASNADLDNKETNEVKKASLDTLDNRKTNWSEIPKSIKELIKNDYSTIRIGEPQELGLTNLGVELFKNNYQDLAVPTSSFGQSMIIPIQSDLIIYEYASTCLLRDMYLGKGNVYVPENLNLQNVMQGLSPNALSKSIGDDIIQRIPGIDGDKIIVEQFDVRCDQWQTIMMDALKRIAVKWSMSPKIISSFLVSGKVAQTATQIDSEDDVSLAWINNSRSDYLQALDNLLETTLNAMGLEHNVTIKFDSPSLLNQDRVLDRTIKKLDAGLISIGQAIRELYPDEEESKLDEMIKEAEKRYKDRKREDTLKFSQDGAYYAGRGYDKNLESEAEDLFKNNYDDLGGENLNGTTTPRQ